MDKNKLNGIRLHEEKPKWMKGTIHKDTNCEGMDDFEIFFNNLSWGIYDRKFSNLTLQLP
jgi:hypothetical protein